MTRLPLLERDVTPMTGDLYPTYKVGPVCAVPWCSRLADHAHHCWRRSFTAGPYDWVKIPDGTVVGNKVALCHRHHDDVTVNRTRLELRLRDGSWLYFWVDDRDDVNEPLSHQPPMRPVTSNAAPALVTGSHDHEGLVGKCPTCKRVLPRPKLDTPQEAARPRKTWSITVPADKIEDGAEVLDVLLESARLMLEEAGIQYGDERKVRYPILATTLALFVQHGDRILSDG